jgi:hypothetical protein
MVFDDLEGVREGNPPCYCGHLSRGQFERGVYVYRCARKACDFEEELEEDA